jgi:hypothetical protein
MAGFAHPIMNTKCKMQNAKLKTHAEEEDGPAFRILRFAPCISNFEF